MLTRPLPTTNTPDYEAAVQFAPNGRSIAFRTWRPAESDEREFSALLLSLEVERVTHFERLFGPNNTWESPFFSFAPNGDLLIRQNTQSTCSSQ